MTISTNWALAILETHPNIGATEFAELMWPDSPAWNKSYKVGRGSAFGAHLVWAAGGYLGRLVGKGLVYRRYSWEHKRYLYDLENTLTLRLIDKQ